MAFSLEQFDGFSKGEISAYGRRRYEDLIKNPTRLGERILPFTNVNDYEVAAGQVSFRPVASAIIAPDSVLPRTPLFDFESKEYGILKTGLKATMKESDLMKFRDFLNLNNIGPRELINTQPYQMANNLVVGYLDRVEAMRWEALSKGTVTISNAGVAVDYGVPGTHKETLAGTDVWTDTDDADGLDDLINGSTQLLDKTGSHARFIVMSTKAFNHLIAQDKTKERLTVTNGSIGQQIAGAAGNVIAGVITRGAVNAYLAAQGIGPVMLYDRKYNEFDFTGATQPTLTRHLDEEYVVMVGSSVTEGYQATVPGASVNGFAAEGPLAQNNFESGLYTWYEENREPFEVEVKSEGWVLPVIFPETLFQLKAW